MRSGKKPESCIPCAKRKVRCDKQQPCNHCKRRKQDVCSYPLADVSYSSRSESDASYIKKLERYVRELGGDHDRIDHYDEERKDEELSQDFRAITRGISSMPTPTSPGVTIDEAPRTNGVRQLHDKAALVAHDEQVTYIETPMWYSWSGANEDTLAKDNGSSAKPNDKTPETRFSHCFPTFLDPRMSLSDSSFSVRYPRAPFDKKLWKVFLKNVHPLTQYFFDWEIEPIMDRAFEDSSSLSTEERALVFSIYFVAVLSVPESESIAQLWDGKSAILDLLQQATEDALLAADFIATSNCTVLQAFMLYLTAMRNRARPATIFSLMGVATRIAERIGIHRDGAALGLSPLRSEERRRMWWAIQHLEISTSMLTGSLTMTMYGDWDSNLPANLDDQDFRCDPQTMPEERRGLTGISHCLSRYIILYVGRAHKHIDGVMWMLSPRVSLAEKDTRIDWLEKLLAEKFLQFCEPLNPLHVWIQIGVHSFILAGRRTARQPAIKNAKISEMSKHERDEFLSICTKSLEYFVLSQTTDSLRGFHWQMETFFQWTAFVFIILETQNRFDDEAVDDLWDLIRRVYAVKPALTIALHRTEISSITRMVLAAWAKRESYLQQDTGDADRQIITPEWIVKLAQQFGLPVCEGAEVAGQSRGDVAKDSDGLFPANFDFDLDTMDWSTWQDPQLIASLESTSWY